ncbi:MAG: polyribonucleotide nucleotidyltransferase [Planctomycetes bacterium]|nr:polyribonucleotide nucleotidyltransferase [Planctomycetota bacterium]
MKQTRTIVVGGRTVELETGRIARQASGAVVVRQDRTTLLVTAVAAPEPRAEAAFFPLTVDYRELTAAAGRIPGGYLKREGRPSDHEVLVSRLVDRSIRPLFPDGFRNEVQVVATVLAAEPDADPVPLALLGAAAALHLSDIPFGGPCGGVTVARAGGALVVLPTRSEREQADLHLTVAVGPDGLIMVEGTAREVPETAVLDALECAEAAVRPFCAALEEWRAVAGKTKMPLAPAPAADPVLGEVGERYGGAVREALLADVAKQARRRRLQAIREEAVGALAGDDEARAAAVAQAVDELVSRQVRGLVLREGRRIGGRGPEEIRDIWAEAGWLATNHGSAIFSRGETQALVSCTLGMAEDEMREDRLFGSVASRFMLHYNFPPYSVGEVRALRGPGRREIGHGNLARRALEPVLPAFADFPYTIRLVSSITESNGSSSMATVCGASLALMDAGVPIRAPVAGIAMGLIGGTEGTAVLSDILGDEDHLGDMDFKVTGTATGITALQMDNKIGGLERAVLERALDQARRGRLFVLERMAAVLAAPRAELPPQAPRVLALVIRPERIGELIGPKGAVIQEIQQATDTRISVDDAGQVLIYSTSGEAAARARRRVHWVAGDPEVGKLYQGTVVSTHNFGAFIRFLGNTEGLCHISELGEGRVAETTDVVKVGDEVVVCVKGVTDQGKLSLSLRAARDCRAEDVIRPD